MNIDDDRLRRIAARSASRVELWAELIASAGLESVAEVGVWKGEFAREILLRCSSISRYYMIDPWAHLPDWNKPFNVQDPVFEDVYAEAMEATAFAKEKVVVLRGRTRDVVDDVPDDSLDFVYIDGDHTLRGITVDLVSLLPKVKRGGFIAGDDFAADPWHHGDAYEPTLVCPFTVYFAEAMNLPILALPFGQFLIQNRPDRPFSFTDTTGEHGDLALGRRLRAPRRKKRGRAVSRLLHKLGSGAPRK